MVKVVIIEKSGAAKTSSIKSFSKNELYKKCNFRNATNFVKIVTWKYSDSQNVSIFGKNKGRAGSENKCDLPPPVDKELYFGKLIVLLHDGEEVEDYTVEDFTKENWEKFYEKLFGGFDDLTKPEESSSEEEIPEEYKTKEGYSKQDGFIVDSDEEEEDDEYIPEEEEEESESESLDEESDNGELGSDYDDDDEEEEEDEEEDDDDDDISDIGSELSEEEYSD